MKSIAVFIAIASSLAAREIQDVSAILEPIREKHSLPALTAAVIDADGIVARGVTGFRKTGEKEKAAIDDLWHLGSETKAITATLAGTFVAEGSLRWDDTVAKHFPEFAARIDPALRNVTFTDLLSHRAGLTPNLPWAEFGRRNLPRERREAARKLLTSPPATPVGGYVYSNAGYVVAGAILEKLGKEPWEDLVRKRIFVPLGIKEAGFGGTGTPGKLDQPWPHFESGAAVVGNGPDTDNPPVMGPAGTIHASAGSWALFLSDQLRGAAGKKALLPNDVYDFIQKPHPEGTGYGLGWGIARRPWANGKVLTHTGSNTMNFAVCWLAVPRQFGILVCTNQAGDKAAKGADEAVAALLAWRRNGG